MIESLRDKIMNAHEPFPTDSIEELAAYWDTHDLTDHEDQLVEAEDVFKRHTVVRVPLDAEQAASSQRIAESQGITLPILIQQWVGEHVQ
jgi:L-ascorbate metabolism protein UlaG (beta-lactamase superfamily)